MSNIPSQLHYTKTHEWVKKENDNVYVIGITDHAQSALGDVVFVELPEIEAEINSQEDVGVIESVKAASEIYAPLTGKVISVNEKLEDTPELLNEDPYIKGWLYKIQSSDQREFDNLLNESEYMDIVKKTD